MCLLPQQMMWNVPAASINDLELPAASINDAECACCLNKCIKIGPWVLGRAKRYVRHAHTLVVTTVPMIVGRVLC